MPPFGTGTRLQIRLASSPSLSTGLYRKKALIGSTRGIEGFQEPKAAGGFTKLAMETVRKWHFPPAQFDGRQTTASLPVVFSFNQPIVWWNNQSK
jgi:hypothetical protein